MDYRLFAECSSLRSKKYYKEYTDEHRIVVNRRRSEKRRKLKYMLDTIKKRYGCQVCGENNIVCLDFHHLDPSIKEFTIGRAGSNEFSVEKLLTEINKCVCLCSNCHRKVHAGWFLVNDSMLCKEVVSCDSSPIVTNNS